MNIEQQLQQQLQQQHQQANHRKRSRRVSVNPCLGEDREIVNDSKNKKARLASVDQQATHQVDITVVFEAASNDADDASSCSRGSFEAESTPRALPLPQQETSSKTHVVVTPRSSMSSLLDSAPSLDQSSSSSGSTTSSGSSSNSSGPISPREESALHRFYEPVMELRKRDNEQLKIISSTAEDAFTAFTEGSHNGTMTNLSSRLFTNIVTSRFSSGSKLAVCVLTISLAIRFFLWLWIMHPVAHLETGDQSVYVTGGGFSGFWFTLGRLRSIPDFLEKDFYCFSAGCLAVVATLGNFSMEEMYGYASDAQVRWKQGTLHRHDVVSAFLDDLLSISTTTTTTPHCTALGNETAAAAAAAADTPIATSSGLDDPHLLSRLNVITTVKNGRFGLTADIRKPNSLLELRTMLLQTTWIPFIVGGDLWHLNHMDGAFSSFYHPKCAYNVGLVPNFDLLSNFANVNLGRDKVEALWEMGLKYGL